MEKRKLALLWATIQIAQTAALILTVKYVLRLGVDPLNFSYQILLVSAVYLLIFALSKEPKALIEINRKSFFTIMLIGIIGGGITHGFGTIGLQQSTATNYAFLIQTTIVFTPVLAFFFLKEEWSLNKTGLIIASLLGTYLISTNGEFLLPKQGDLFIILAAGAFSLGVILTKITLIKVSTATFSVYRSLFGGLSLLLFLLLIRKVNLDFNWFWIIIAGSLIALGTFSKNRVLEYASASYMQMMATSSPVLTAIVAYFIFGDLLSSVQMIGGMLILASVYLIHTLKI